MAGARCVRDARGVGRLRQFSRRAAAAESSAMALPARSSRAADGHGHDRCGLAGHQCMWSGGSRVCGLAGHEYVAWRVTCVCGLARHSGGLLTVMVTAGVCKHVHARVYALVYGHVHRHASRHVFRPSCSQTLVTAGLASVQLVHMSVRMVCPRVYAHVRTHVGVLGGHRHSRSGRIMICRMPRFLPHVRVRACACACVHVCVRVSIAPSMDDGGSGQTLSR